MIQPGLRQPLTGIYPMYNPKLPSAPNYANVQSKTSYQHRAAVTEDLKAITNANSPMKPRCR